MRYDSGNESDTEEEGTEGDDEAEIENGECITLAIRRDQSATTNALI